MSNDNQTTSKLLPNRFLTKAERELFSFLKEGPREYSEIWRHLKKKSGISQQTSNRLLNKNVKENRVFQIKKGTRAFYRINDFPLNVKALLVLLDCAIKEKELVLLDNADNGVKEGESVSEVTALAIYRFLYQTPMDKQALVVYQTLKRNIIRLYPKLDLRKIVQFTIAEISASASGNQSLLNFLEGLKAALD